MKKVTILTILILLFSVTSIGQLDKRYWLVGGAGSFYSYNDDFTTTGQSTVSGKLTEVNLTGNIGYFLFDKFAAGLRPGINLIKSRGLNTASSSTKDVAIYVGPFTRYYFLNKDKPFNILLDVACQIGTYSTFAGTGSFRNASVMCGSEIFFNTSTSFEILLGYLHQKKAIKEGQPGFSNERNGFHISIGFQIHLTKN